MKRSNSFSQMLRIEEERKIPTNILYTRDHILMKKVHIIYFIDTKGNSVDEIGKELIYRKICQISENFKGTLGHVFTANLIKEDFQYLIIRYLIIIKEELKQKISEEIIMRGFKELKNEMRRFNILHANISENKSKINISWFKIRK